MKNYTVLIPHKNQPDLLKKAISSIPHNDDVQIIVVDDASDLDIVDFENFPGLDDPKVEVIFTKEGKGAGYARNIGMPRVEGKWVMFLGADDFFNPCIEDAMRDYADDDSDVIFFEGNGMDLLTGEESNRGDGYNASVEHAIATGDFLPALLNSCDTRKFFKVSFIKEFNISFSECRWGNDVFFMGQVARYARIYKASPLKIYCATVSGTNLTKANSIESQVVRFKEECKNVKVLRPRYRKVESVFYWQFRSWFNVYKLSKGQAIALLPRAVDAGGFKFIGQVFKAIFS